MRFGSCVFLMLMSCDGSKPSIGEYESVLHEEVITVDYETPDFRLTAHRFRANGPFVITVQSKDGSYRHCTSDESFERNVAPFESLRSMRRIEEQEFARLTRGKPFHRLRIALPLPMEAFERVLSQLPNGHMAVSDGDAGYELSPTTQDVERLSQSCGSAHGRR
jgi:hypothetical protein